MTDETIKGSPVFVIAYGRWLKRMGLEHRTEWLLGFRAGWIAHNKARAGRNRPKWARG